MTARRAWRLLPHTADLRVEAAGPDLPALFEACVLALFSLVTDRRRVRAARTRIVRAGGATPEDRLYGLLRGAFRLAAVDGFFVRGAHVRMKGTKLSMKVRGEPFDPARHAVHREVKAVTAHAIEVRRGPGGCIARFVVDV